MFKFTPRDIQNQEFRKILRGYDPVEVEAFLEMISDEFELLLRLKNELENNVQKYKTEINNYKKLLETGGAKRGSPGSRELSKKEVELMLRNAELKIKEKTEQARRELQRMKDEIAFLKSKKESYVLRLKQLLNSQVEMIKVLEIDEKKEVSGIEEIERRRRIGSPTESLTKKAESREEPLPESFPLESLPPEVKTPGFFTKTTTPAMPPQKRAASQRETQQKKPPEAPEAKSPVTLDKQKALPKQPDKIPGSGIQDGFNFIDNIIDEEEYKEPEKPKRNRKI